MSIILHFLLGGAVSFIGSLPMGLINLTVAETAISRGMRAALWLAFGAVLVEFGQILIALFFADWFFDDEVRQFWMRAIGSVVFIILGLYYIVKKVDDIHVKQDEQTGKHNSFLRGLGLSAVNMMAIPFWLVYGAMLQTQDILSKEGDLMLSFALGAAIGTFGLFIVYARLGMYILRRAKLISRYASTIIGCILLGLGLFFLIKLFV
ncbi:MAG: LysE family translocator [Bacteroidia bacterium]